MAINVDAPSKIGAPSKIDALEVKGLQIEQHVSIVPIV